MKRNYSELEAHFEKCIGKYSLLSRQIHVVALAAGAWSVVASGRSHTTKAKIFKF
jgi:hypothetical protein